MAAPPPPPPSGTPPAVSVPSPATAPTSQQPLRPAGNPPPASQPPAATSHSHYSNQYNNPAAMYPIPPNPASTIDNPAEAFINKSSEYSKQFQAILDRLTPHTVQRWTGTAVLLFIFALRVIIGQGWYIVCYGLSIYLLNIFLAFLQPRFDPALEADLTEQDIEEGGSTSPSNGESGSGGGDAFSIAGIKKLFGTNGGGNTGEDGEEEFRPFIRRLPEFKFWLSATRATLFSLLLSMTRASDIPVYWPILMVYFFTLFGLTMRRQLRHMIKFKYIPFDIGRKTTYGRKSNK